MTLIITKMNILITEQQLNVITLQSILNESIEDEVNKLQEWGYDVVEQFKFLNYTMFLLYHKEEDFYEISLTTDENDFTSYQDQVKKPATNNPEQIRIAFAKMSEKIKQWISRYGILVIGSLNKKRTYKYHKLLSSIGFNVSDIKHNLGDEHFPDYWDFNINQR